MDKNTLKKISLCIQSLLHIDGVSAFGGVGNMLYGLFDGFDYSEQIQAHKDMEVIKKSSAETWNLITTICKTIDTYPKSNTDVTIH